MATSKKTARSGETIKIKQIGSLIGCTDKQRATVRGLGLRRMHHVVERPDTPEVRGMVKAVPHLVTVVDFSTATAK
jgi:large subunit ribosomal protein L30